MTRTNRFNLVSGANLEPAHQWDKTCKLFSLAKICTLLSTVLVTTIITEKCYINIPLNSTFTMFELHDLHLPVVIAECLFDVVPIVVNSRYFMTSDSYMYSLTPPSTH